MSNNFITLFFNNIVRNEEVVGNTFLKTKSGLLDISSVSDRVREVTRLLGDLSVDISRRLELELVSDTSLSVDGGLQLSARADLAFTRRNQNINTINLGLRAESVGLGALL